MKASQEPKYTIGYDENDSPVIINRMTGDPIPDDEPIMIFRGKDAKSIHAIAEYLKVCHSHEHKAAIAQRLVDFIHYQHCNPALVHEPDTELWPVDG